MGSEVTITGLVNAAHLWDFATMKLRAVMRWFLALGIAVGIVIGPAAPLMAAIPSSSASMTSASADEDAMQMADGMPCCPKKQAPMRSDCDKCALSNCMIKLSGPSQASAFVEVPVLIARIVPVSEFVPAGLAKPPPERPPRTNV
jgi:hypothetical protein